MDSLGSLSVLMLACLAAAKPLPTPPELLEDCTATMTTTLPAPRLQFPTLTRTVYTATETFTSRVDCHGCLNLDVITTRFNFGHGPAVLGVETVTAPTPLTLTEHACRTKRIGRLAIPGIPPEEELEEREAKATTTPPPGPTTALGPPACVTVMTVTANNAMLWGSQDRVRTIYPSTQTVYDEVDCKGCFLEIEVKEPRWLGVPPVLIYTDEVTTTAPLTITNTVCAGSVPAKATPAPGIFDVDPNAPPFAGLPKNFPAITRVPYDPIWIPDRRDQTGAPVPRAVEEGPAKRNPSDGENPYPTLKPYLGIPPVWKPEIDYGDQPDPDAPAVTPGPEGCTMALLYLPSMTFGPVWRVWTETVTVISSIDCKGCTAVTRDLLHVGPGPVVFFTTTVTESTPSTTLEYACATTTQAPLEGPPQKHYSLPVEPIYVASLRR